MNNQEAISVLESIDAKTDYFLINDDARAEALDMAISALQAQKSKTKENCDTCKHDPPSKKWPCVDCDMRAPADRWEAQDVPDTNVGDMVSRRFVELLAEYHDPEICPYKEYKGKPYFSIKYIENGDGYIGYGTYSPKVLSQYLRDYFMVTAQPDNHAVACLLAELFGDTCACNFNDIDEWLPDKCEFLDACPDPGGVTCWEQYLKYRAERRTDETD